jgi:hypothetical protein
MREELTRNLRPKLHLLEPYYAMEGVCGRDKLMDHTTHSHDTTITVPKDPVALLKTEDCNEQH